MKNIDETSDYFYWWQRHIKATSSFEDILHSLSLISYDYYHFSSIYDELNSKGYKDETYKLVGAP